MVKVERQEETNPDGGGTMLLLGKHHIMVETSEVVEREDDGEILKQVKVNVKALASTEPAMVGRDRTEYLKIAGKAAGMLWNLAIALGCRSIEQWRIVNECLESGAVMPKDENGLDLDDIPTDDFVGRQCLCEVVDASFVAKEDSRVGKFKKGEKVLKSEIGFRWYPLIPHDKNREFDKFVLNQEDADLAIPAQYPGYDPAAAPAGPAPGTPAGAPAKAAAKPAAGAKAPAKAAAAAPAAGSKAAKYANV